MRWLSIFVFLVVIAVGIIYAWDSHSRMAAITYDSQSVKHEFIVIQAHQLLGFNLVDPEQAPSNIRDSVMRGYHLMMHPAFYAPDYAGNQLDCVNCHFAGGDTLGGKNGSISLVGVTTVYPSYSQRAGKVITLADRINNCFRRSLNGNALPLDSRMMNDILNYLHWISKEVKSIKNIPWLGLPEIKSEHKPDAQEGKKVYEQCCAACHLSNGQGGGELSDLEGKTIPPLWGPNSFNDGAGMNTMRMMVPFVYLNMPYQQAHLIEDQSLSVEQALDVSAYILQQPRPHFEP